MRRPLAEEVHIAAAGNTEVPAYLTLLHAGYQVSRKVIGSKEEWKAIRADIVLVAENPLELLGLAHMRETRGFHWKAGDKEITDFIGLFYPD